MLQTVRRLGAVGPLAVIAATLPALGGFALLYFIRDIADWLASHGAAGPLVYVTGFALLAGLALLPTYAQAVLGGFAFRFEVGFPAALSGFLGGALLGYAVARRASGERAKALIDQHARSRAVYDALLGGGFLKTLAIVTLVRLPPNSPFAIMNLALAAAKVPLRQYLPGTLLGMAPRTAAAVYIGSTLEDVADQSRPLWLTVASIAAAIVVVVLIGHIANRALSRLASPAA